MVFREKLIDIQTSEIEFKLTKFWLNISDEDSMIEGLDDCSSINPIYPGVEETIKKRNKRQRVGTFENFIYIQTSCRPKHSNQRDSIWLPPFGNLN